ncbi:pyruvate, phosphate dikinase [Brumimicrobium oceani]|uniref:Pyruvate, phosphate dikinase n=2 Tax=Brumimicrobium oceani TaxID=2100725 RepID=A0A2U2XGS1_9FLAO|nr:pyruvate, phosphate dikinase [Brumimicrobium oceani]
MLDKKTKEYLLTGTKAETLEFLENIEYNVPSVFYFTVKEWKENKLDLIEKVLAKYEGNLLAIRSSTKAEDTADSSMAGAFESILNVKLNAESIDKAVEKVIASFDEDQTNQILVQPMVTNVAMSGVIMTQVLDDGSPYYVVNYDDKTGLTDTVTSGATVNKTVYIYYGVDRNDFDSPFLLLVLDLIEALKLTFPNIPLDIEFAINKSMEMSLLQVRKITTVNTWKMHITDQVSDRMLYLKEYVGQLMQNRPHLYGQKTLLGFMPDWNPAEMIGVVPHPLAMSLYRELITKRVWSVAREKMGYRKMPNVELMISLFGRAYIDVRNSINSFLPEGLPSAISEKMVNAYIERLNKFPFLHDKIEFEVVHTAYDFDFEKNFQERYPDVLSREEFLNYKGLLRNLTIKAIDDKYESSLNVAIRDIEILKSIQKVKYLQDGNSFSIADQINTQIDECKNYGTLPFSIIARHGFIAEGILRSAVSNKGISEERVKEFKSSFNTVAGELSEDFQRVLKNELSKDEYLSKYGHLRPGSYDILSPNYANREDLFEGIPRKNQHSIKPFKLSKEETSKINILLGEHGFDNIKAEDLFKYAKKAIIGREYAKFIFTKHLSEILENMAEWGKIEGFTRDQLAMLSIEDVLSVLIAPLTDDTKSYYERKIDKAENNFSVASSFKLSYLIRSVRDVHIVPMQRSEANFIGNRRIEAEVVELTPYTKEIPLLENKIICIEGADPGYDWIFTRNIGGLITKYGGANSHMAIRSAELNIPAAIGCGEQPYNRIVAAQKCLLDCQRKNLEPIELS